MNLFIKAHFKTAQFSYVIVLLIYFVRSVILDIQVSNIIMCTYNLIFKLVIFLIVYFEMLFLRSRKGETVC